MGVLNVHFQMAQRSSEHLVALFGCSCFSFSWHHKHQQRHYDVLWCINGGIYCKRRFSCLLLQYQMYVFLTRLRRPHSFTIQFSFFCRPYVDYTLTLKIDMIGMLGIIGACVGTATYAVTAYVPWLVRLHLTVFCMLMAWTLTVLLGLSSYGETENIARGGRTRRQSSISAYGHFFCVWGGVCGLDACVWRLESSGARTCLSSLV